jgi:hypothetical protein
MELFEEYQEGFENLKMLYKKRTGELDSLQCRQRLNKIFIKCEEKWEENLNRLTEVKYLLIAEAAPWSENGPINYFYNTFKGPWCNRIWKAFFDETAPNDVNKALKRLAEKQFLLIDSLPFSMKYTSYYRNKPYYSKLVKSCSGYLTEKLDNEKIKRSKNVKLALAFKLNGNAIINAFPNGIDLPNGQTVKLCQSLIATDASNYTNSNKLKDIWCIDNNRI